MEKKKRKEIIEWSVALGVMAVLYVTGLHTEVIGTLQRVILATGIMAPDQPESKVVVDADDFDFDLIGLDGKEISFSHLKGKTIFLNLWATWCPPCIAEMPEIQSLYEKVQSNDIAFVMLSMDDDREKPIRFIERKEFTFPVYTLKNGLPQVFHSQSIPTTFVISPEGEIVVRQAGMASYDTESFRALLLNR